MFDSYAIRSGDQHHSHTHTVTEKRAPTDESVRLLSEMEAAAREKVLNAVRLENCPIDGIAFEWCDSHMDLKRQFFLRAKLNGRPLEVRYDHNMMRGDKAEITEGLLKATAEAVAAQILDNALKALNMSKFGNPLR